MPDPFDCYSSSPVVSGGNVYFGSGDGNVYALTLPPKGELEIFRPVTWFTPRRRLRTAHYCRKLDSYFYALDVANGKKSGSSRPAKITRFTTRSAFNLPRR